MFASKEMASALADLVRIGAESRQKEIDALTAERDDLRKIATRFKLIADTYGDFDCTCDNPVGFVCPTCKLVELTDATLAKYQPSKGGA